MDCKPKHQLGRSQRLLLDCLNEELQGELGLEGRHLMAGRENPQPAEIAHGLERALHFTIDGVVGHGLVLEFLLTVVLDLVHRCVATKPVADGIRVAGKEDCGDPGLHHG